MCAVSLVGYACGFADGARVGWGFAFFEEGLDGSSGFFEAELREEGFVGEDVAFAGGVSME